MKIILFCLCCLLIITELGARNIQLLTSYIGSSPKTIAQGNIEGLSSGSSAVFENAAALFNSDYSLSLMSTELSDADSTFTCLSGSFPFFNGHIGLGMLGVESKNLDKTAIGNFDQFYSEYKFGTRDSTYFAAYQYMMLPQLSVGATLKYVDQDLFTTRGTGLNMDIGLLWIDPNYKLAASAKNILQSLKVIYSQDQSELSFPSEYTLSGRYALGDCGIAAQLKYREGSPSLLKSAGVDYSPFSEWITLYGGWKEVAAISKIHNTYGVGIGLDLGTICINASYEMSDFLEQDSKRYLSIETKF